eukprot:8901056-Pyramimonas_sp.AAC.2
MGGGDRSFHRSHRGTTTLSTRSHRITHEGPPVQIRGDRGRPPPLHSYEYIRSESIGLRLGPPILSFNSGRSRLAQHGSVLSGRRKLPCPYGRVV